MAEINTTKNDEISGLKNKYNPDKHLPTPFPEQFKYENCICVFYSVILNEKYKTLKRVYHNAKFYKSFTENDMVGFDYKGFSLNGVYILTSTKEESVSILEDIKSNTENYKENYLDCI